MIGISILKFPKFSKDKPCKIVIVDDHPIFMRGLSQLIEEDTNCCVCGDARDAEGAFRVVEEIKPDLVILDISLRAANGIDVLKKLRAIHPGLQALVVSTHENCVYAERAYRAGALGYVMKQASPEEVLKAIRKAVHGETYVPDDPSAGTVTAGSNGNAEEIRFALDRLTDRELQVLEMIGRGGSTADIAGNLGLSRKTVEVHRTNAKDKLNLRTSSDLVRYAVQWMQDR